MVARRGESFKKKEEWRPLYGGTQGGKLNKEVERRPLYSGTQEGKFK